MNNACIDVFYKLRRAPFFVCDIYFLLIVSFHTRNAGQELGKFVLISKDRFFSFYALFFYILDKVNIFRAFFVSLRL